MHCCIDARKQVRTFGHFNDTLEIPEQPPSHRPHTPISIFLQRPFEAPGKAGEEPDRRVTCSAIGRIIEHERHNLCDLGSIGAIAAAQIIVLSKRGEAQNADDDRSESRIYPTIRQNVTAFADCRKLPPHGRPNTSIWGQFRALPVGELELNRCFAA